MVGDPVGDFIIRLKNAGAVSHSRVTVPYSKFKHAIADRLVTAGFLATAEKRGKKAKKVLDIELKYTDAGEPTIRGVKRLSKPGRRLYIGVGNIYPIKFGQGRIILSTPVGVLTGEEAKAQNVGGEQLFIIW